MNREQAQRILLAYRLGEPVSKDSDLGRALALANEDPALAMWLEQELETDRVIRSRLREVSLPVGLRDRILTAAKIVPLPWWRRPRVLVAAAAVLMVTFGSVVGWKFAMGPDTAWARLSTWAGAPRDLATFESEMVRFVSKAEYALELHSDELAEVKRYLAERGKELEPPIPAALERLRTYGCQVFDWHGESVTLICFRARDVGIAHLFVIDASALRDPPSAESAVASVGSWSASSWREGDKVVMVCSPADGARLKQFLRG